MKDKKREHMFCFLCSRNMYYDRKDCSYYSEPKDIKDDWESSYLNPQPAEFGRLTGGHKVICADCCSIISYTALRR